MVSDKGAVIASEPLGSATASAAKQSALGPCHANFELDLVAALAEQLEAALGKLSPATLGGDSVDQLDARQGVYALYRRDNLVYIGKAETLKGRLQEHRFKLSGRQNITVEEMKFSALYVSSNWTAFAPEESLIKHFRRLGYCEWNGNGFGPHDPGRNRELTDKRPDGFDMQFPIQDTYKVESVRAGRYRVLELLVLLKDSLPYLLRYEIEKGERGKGHYRRGHAAYNDVVVDIQRDGMTAKEILKTIADSLGWQATVFPSHMILYNESRHYKFGRAL